MIAAQIATRYGVHIFKMVDKESTLLDGDNIIGITSTKPEEEVQ